jgi:spore coat protein A
VTQLTRPPPVYVPTNVYCDGKLVKQEYVIDASEFYQQILPTEDIYGEPLGQTKVWGYGGIAKDAVTGALLGYVRNSLAPSFEASRGVPVQVKWINNLVDDQGNPLSHMFAVDPTLHWANPNDIPMTGMPNAPSAPFPEYPPGFDGTVDASTNPYGYDTQTPVPIVMHLHGGETQSFYEGGPDQWFTADDDMALPTHH